MKNTDFEMIFSYNNKTKNIHIIQNCVNINANAMNINDLLIIRNCIFNYICIFENSEKCVNIIF